MATVKLYGYNWRLPLEDHRNDDFVIREYKDPWYRDDEGNVHLGRPRKQTKENK